MKDKNSVVNQRIKGKLVARLEFQRREVLTYFSYAMDAIQKANSELGSKELPSFDDIENLYEYRCPNCGHGVANLDSVVGKAEAEEGLFICPDCEHKTDSEWESEPQNDFIRAKKGNNMIKINDKCPKCDGVMKFYDGMMGYESIQCDKCHFDVNDGEPEAAHTKGPWSYDEVWALIMGPDKEEICAVHSALHADAKRQKPKIATANARLIAAAPDLLEACKAAIAMLNQNKTFPADLEFIKNVLTNAINKARGANI